MIKIGIALMSMLSAPDCHEIPYTEEDSAELNSMAQEIASARFRAAEFERVTISNGREQGVHDNKISELETLRFEGLFANTSTTPDLSEREQIRCRIYRMTDSRGQASLERSCTRVTKRELSYPGVAVPVDLAEGLTVEEARLVLSFLSGLVGQKIGRMQTPFTREQFSSIHRMSVTGSAWPTRKFYATLESGCASHDVWVSVSESSGLVFEEVGRSRYIC